jgi:uncharacterized membrane protein
MHQFCHIVPKSVIVRNASKNKNHEEDFMSILKVQGNAKEIYSTQWLAVSAMLMAMNVALSSFGVPVPGGHLYLNDVVICTAGLLLDPLGAFLVGGVGAFLGDFFFYPAPMFVSLFTHGLQAIVISLISHRLWNQRREAAAILAVTVGAVIMVVGYSLGRAFIYSTPEYALLKLPFQIMQAVIGAVSAIIVCYPFRLQELYRRLVQG